MVKSSNIRSLLVSTKFICYVTKTFIYNISELSISGESHKIYYYTTIIKIDNKSLFYRYQVYQRETL